MPKNKSTVRLQESLLHGKWCLMHSAYDALLKQVNNIGNNDFSNVVLSQGEPTDYNNVVFDETDNSNSNGVGIVQINGILVKNPSDIEVEFFGCTDIDTIREYIENFANDDTVSHILLDFDSPGGETIGIQELADYINKVDASIKPVYAYTDNICGSAAYWLASQTRYFASSRTAQVGSIGVYTLIMDESAAYDSAGVKVNAISAGNYKLLGHSFRQLSDEERALVQADVDSTYNDFTAAVTNKRNIDAADLQGLSYTGTVALNKHLVDANYDTLEEFLNKYNFMKKETLETSAVSAPSATSVAATSEIKTSATATVAGDLPGVPGVEEGKAEDDHDADNGVCPHCGKPLNGDHEEPDGDEKVATGVSTPATATDAPQANVAQPQAPVATAAPAAQAAPTTEAPALSGDDAWRVAFGLPPVKRNNALQEAIKSAFKI